MKPALLVALLLLAGPAGAVSIQLPNETAMLPDSGHPGYPTALQRCLICHSADYIALQPDFSQARWQAIVDKIARRLQGADRAGGGGADRRLSRRRAAPALAAAAAAGQALSAAAGLAWPPPAVIIVGFRHFSTEPPCPCRPP